MTGIELNKLMESQGINLDDLPGQLYVKFRLVIEDVKSNARNEAIEESLKEFNYYAQSILPDIAESIEKSILKLKS